jgi:hypothetical protein
MFWVRRKLRGANQSFASLRDDPHALRRKWRRGLYRVRRRLWNGHLRVAAYRFFMRALEEVAGVRSRLGDCQRRLRGRPRRGGPERRGHLRERGRWSSGPSDAASRNQCRFIFGDHDLGKYSTLLRGGGIRLRSLQLGEEQLGIPSFWHEQDEDTHLIGVNSSLFTLDQFLPEALAARDPGRRSGAPSTTMR